MVGDTFTIGRRIWLRNGNGPRTRWLRGHVRKVSGTTVTVALDNGRLVDVHYSLARDLLRVVDPIK